MKYNHKEIEKKWQRRWEEEGIYRAEFPSKKKKYYVLIEFPYPSGERLHVGHARSYSAMDVLARKRRMEGYNVLYPIGWDAFGLPAENYAIKTGIHPAKTTQENVKNAKKQAVSWGLSFDWSREINTTDPAYYKWTQWIFLQLFKHGLAYRAKIPVNWCPSCKINLANEEVVDGKCERCGAQTSRRMQEQWMLRITKYADRLLADLEKVDYREDIRKQQEEWIGRSEGALIKFQISSTKLHTIEVFTTRLDTLFGATALVIAPEKMIGNKRLALEIASKEQYQKVKKYIEDAQNKSELERTELKEKTGVFTGSYAINPVNKEQIPIWVADYVIGWYGEGAIMLVPAHDERDWEFAQKNNISIKKVVEADRRGYQADQRRNNQRQSAWHQRKSASSGEAFIGEGILVNSGKYTGLKSEEAREKMQKDGERYGWARGKVTYRLRDWVFSRQHYWGEPIPIVYCESCGEVAVPEEDLPVKLPHVEKYEPTETGESPLANVKEWVNVACPKCGGNGRRETDTMPNWAGSSWYFLRYCDSKNDTKIASENALKYWLPVDWYNGGMEHTTLHLLYSRFWHKFLYDIGVVPTAEPYAKRTSHGQVLGPDGRKMSKSRGNVINPDEIVEEYGADTLRMYEMFMGPFAEEISWDEQALGGVRRFLERVWRLYVDVVMPLLQRRLHRTVKKVGEDIEGLKFNTAIAAMMEYINEVYRTKDEGLKTEEAGVFLRILAPFAPHLAEELWQGFKSQTLKKSKSLTFNSVHTQPWPEYDARLVEEETVEFVVQVNGTVREKLNVKCQVSSVKPEMEEMARGSVKVQRYLEGRKVRKVVFVPGKLINFVIK